MPRIIITYETLFEVLKAEKALKAHDEPFRVRPTPTPPFLSTSICGMSLELLQAARKDEVVKYLKSLSLDPRGVHEVDT